LVEDINQYFLIEPTETSTIELEKKIIDEHFIQLSQRSERWQYLLKEFYQCGKNSGDNIKKTVEGMYNLIRGAITEAIILSQFNPELIGLEEWKKVNVGLLVEQKDKLKSAGCSPDLLLINNGKIIPVEIKTLASSTHNSDFYNKFELAECQLNCVENILGKDIIMYKIIIMSHWALDELILETYFIS
jgi:hypothetical protein